MANQSQVSLLEDRLARLKAQGLSDYKFFPGEVSTSSPETFAKEANAWLTAIEEGRYKPLVFNDKHTA